MRPLLALALLAAACGQAPEDLGPFAIRFEFDQRPGSQCEAATCDAYGMTCGATLGIRILDVEDQDRVVADACETVAPSATLCGLGNISSPTFFNIPPHRLRIEVSAWRPEVLEADPDLDGACPDEQLFDVRGVPLTTFQPQPAFAGAAYFDAGSDEDTAVVPLSCTDVTQLEQAECGVIDTTPIVVTVDDIETALDISESQAENLTVGVAEPRAVPDGSGGTAYVIDGGDTIALALEAGPVPIFAGETDQTFEEVCAVLLDLTPQSTASVHCQVAGSSQDRIDLRGVLVGVATLDQILDAMEAETFPTQGLVVGRVVDHTGAPLANVTVDAGEGTVEYLSADRSALIGDATSTSGFFIALDAPFGTSWTAIHNGDGRREVGDPSAGLVRDKVTALLIRMEPP